MSDKRGSVESDQTNSRDSEMCIRDRFHTPDVKHSIRVNRQLYSKQSDYQRIDIFETPEFGRVLTLDGNVMLKERDEFIYDEMITHVPMAVHKEARDILVDVYKRQVYYREVWLI